MATPGITAMGRIIGEKRIDDIIIATSPDAVTAICDLE